MKFLKHIFTKHRPIAISILAVLVFMVLIKVFASGGPQHDQPGTVLNPTYGPGNEVVDVGGGMVIGNPVTGGAITQVLYTADDGSGNPILASDEGFTRDSQPGGSLFTFINSEASTRSPMTGANSELSLIGDVSTGGSMNVSWNYHQPFIFHVQPIISISAGISADNTGLQLINNNGTLNTSWHWPATDGNPGDVLSTSGAVGGSVLTWAPAGGSGWSLTGNAGTTPGTNFIGTTDDQDLILKRDNILYGKFMSTDMFLGYNAGENFDYGVKGGDYNVFIGYQAGQNDGGNPDDNTAVGHNALQQNANWNNTAVGAYSLEANTSGQFETAIGYNSGMAQTIGNDNVFLGDAAGSFDATGASNLYAGSGTGATNVSGYDDTFLGADSNVSVDGLHNATALGYNAVVGASNSLILGGTGSDAVNVGIGTTTPTHALEVVGGSIKATDGLIIQAVTSDPGSPEVGQMWLRTDL